jgi:hypothetical protein
MAPECTFVSPDGRKCRRIPRLGEPLCRHHLRLAAARSPESEEQFDQLMDEAAGHIAALPLDKVLDHLAACLASLNPLVQSRASAGERENYTRATIAASTAIDCLGAQSTMLALAFPGLKANAIPCVLELLWTARPSAIDESQAPKHMIPQCMPTNTAESKRYSSARAVRFNGINHLPKMVRKGIL